MLAPSHPATQMQPVVPALPHQPLLKTAEVTMYPSTGQSCDPQPWMVHNTTQRYTVGPVISLSVSRPQHDIPHQVTQVQGTQTTQLHHATHAMARLAPWPLRSGAATNTGQLRASARPSQLHNSNSIFHYSRTLLPDTVGARTSPQHVLTHSCICWFCGPHHLSAALSCLTTSLHQPIGLL